MGIKNKSKEGLIALQGTLTKFKHIKKVHFTEEGEHYFNSYALDTEDEEGNEIEGKYGRINTEAKATKVVGERQFFKYVPSHTPEAQIVETLTRDQVLNYTFGSDSPKAESKVTKEKAAK